jgi:hypothetical protein
MNNLRQQIAVQNDEHPPQQMAVEDRHFPLILHDILDYSECTGDVHTIVSWHPEGCAFKIHNIQKFIQILPLFFRHKNYKSFQRQLNHYAFERIWEGPEKGKAVKRFSAVASCVVSIYVSSIHYLPFSFPKLS